MTVEILTFTNQHSSSLIRLECNPLPDDFGVEVNRPSSFVGIAAMDMLLVSDRPFSKLQQQQQQQMKKCFLLVNDVGPRGVSLSCHAHKATFESIFCKEINNGSPLKKLYYCPINSLISPWREFLALHELHTSPLLPTILRGQENHVDDGIVPCKISNLENTIVEMNSSWYDPKLGEAYMLYLNRSFNASQLSSIQCGMIHDKGISLIQGPPGICQYTL